MSIRNMQLKSLTIFCDVVRRRSFSRAADDNGISQSSASQVVHQLEENLGVQLLDRTKRPFVLTPAGERYYAGCRQIVRQLSKLEDEVRSYQHEFAGKLAVASIYSVGLAHMSAFMQRFSAAYPKAQVRLEYWHPDRVLQAVEDGDVDLGLVSYPEESRTLSAWDWRTEKMWLVCHPEHRLASQESVSWSDLEDESFIAFEPGLRIRSEIDRALMINKVDVEISLEFDNIENIKRAIEIGEGISILPEPTVTVEVENEQLVQVPFRNDPVERPLGIIARRDRSLGPVGMQFIELLRNNSDFTQEVINNSNETFA